MNQPRLLIAAEIFPPRIGGPATYAATLARELPSRGWQVTVLCYGETVAGEYAASTNIIAVPRRGGAVVRYARYFFSLWRLAKDFPLIYAQGPVSSGLPALIVAKLRRKKFVIKVTGDYAWEQAFRAGATKVFIEEFQRQRIFGKYGILRLIERTVCRHADLVVAPSNFLRRMVEGWGVKPQKIEVIFNAVHLPSVGLDRIRLRQRLGVASDDFLVLTVGRAVPWKGFGVLGTAVAQLRQQYPRIRLVCVGITTRQLAGMMADVGASTPPDGKRLFGTGPLAHDAVQEWLQGADVFVLNTAYEGLSHITLEAIAAGVPVITTAAGGNRELLALGKSGVHLVEYGNAEQLKQTIVELLHHPEPRRSGFDAADKLLTQFQLPVMLQKTEACLTSLMTDQLP